MIIMLLNRITGAFTFRRGVYAEVEHDVNFTRTAWWIVIVVALLNEVGSNVSTDAGRWVIGTIAGTLVAVVGFAAVTYLLYWIGERFFYAEVTFQEVVRVAGLAYVWRLVGLLGVFGLLSSNITSTLVLIGEILWLIALLIAIKEALDKEWFITIVIAFLSWVGWIVVRIVFGTILFWTDFAAEWLDAFFKMIFGG
jgi:hypothetical protein